MQNEIDDIDELFRRAAESYPLKTSGSAWNKISEKLETKKPGAIILFIRNRFSRILILLFLSVAITGSGIYYFLNHKNVSPNDVINGQLHNKTVNGYVDNTESISDIHENKAVNSIHIKDKESFRSSTSKLVRKEDQKRLIHITHQERHNNIHNSYKTNRSSGSLKSSLQSPTPLSDSNSSILSIPNPKENSEIQQEAIEIKRVPPENLVFVESKKTEDNKKGSTTVNDTTTLTVKSINKNKIYKNKNIYASIIAGPDFSNIKQQSYSKAGVSAGILLGYTLNRVSFETGFLLDKKFYYTDGKYFNPKPRPNQVPPPYPRKFNLSGFCNMIEIPLNVSYKINNENKNIFLIKGGFSSYFMNKEDYDFIYNEPGNTYVRNVSYKKSSNSNNWLAVINLGVGYSHYINHSTSLGIEPYLKIPVKNIGRGRMPISSLGIFAVLTRKFKK